MDREARRRQASADFLERGQRTLALNQPQRPGHRVLRRQRVGQRRCGTMRNAGAAIEARQALFTRWPAKLQERNERRQRSDDEQRKTDGTRREGKRQPQTGPGRRQKQPDDTEQPGQMRPPPLPANRQPGALQRLRELKLCRRLTIGMYVALGVVVGRGAQRSTTISDVTARHTSTAAAMRHGTRAIRAHAKPEPKSIRSDWGHEGVRGLCRGTPAVRSLAPLLRGEGGVRGSSRSAYLRLSLKRAPCPAPHPPRRRGDLSPRRAGRGKSPPHNQGAALSMAISCSTSMRGRTTAYWSSFTSTSGTSARVL